MSKQRVIGIYGGTFDPIHFGHLNLAIELKERCALDEVWFCPAYCSPDKLGVQQTAAEHRLKMVELAIEEIPHFSLLDLEIKRGGPSYTIDTLQALYDNKENSTQFRLILGNDTVQYFSSWKEAEQLIRLAPLLVGRRVEKPSVLNFPENEVIPSSLMEISSSTIRERLNHKLYCGHLLPSKVLDYIYKHRLYLAH